MALVDTCSPWATSRTRSLILAVDGQIEERKITGSFCNLKPYTDGPDIFQSEWSFLTDQFSFVPGLIAADSDDVHDMSSTYGRTRMALTRVKVVSRPEEKG
jgi:hypothetical protein